MILKATLNKSWTSPEGRKYPAGTVFTLDARWKQKGHSLYMFSASSIGTGLTILPDAIFNKLNQKEAEKASFREKTKNQTHWDDCILYTIY